LKLLSREVDRDPALKPLEIEGDLADGEESFFLLMLLAVLSTDVEITLLEEEEEEEEAGNAGLTEGFSSLLTPDPVDALKNLSMGTEFLVSETLPVLTMGFVGGKELLLSSGRDLLTGSETALVFPLVFCRFVEETGCFSGTPPVLFLLAIGTDLVLQEDAFLAATFELESELFFGSVLFRIEPIGVKRWELAEMVGFVVFETFIGICIELTDDCCLCFSEVGDFLAASSLKGSSIFKLR
jgi:hypothetical protein